MKKIGYLECLTYGEVVLIGVKNDIVYFGMLNRVFKNYD